MELKVSIRTPSGQASGTEKKLRPFVIGRSLGKRTVLDTYTSPNDDEIIWVVETDIRNALKIQRNVAMFDKFIKGTMDNKLVKKLLNKELSKKDSKELENMLVNHTSVEVIKKATQEEKDEHQTSWWERVKTTFKKKS